MIRISSRRSDLLSTERGELFKPQSTGDFNPCRPVVKGLDKNAVRPEFRTYIAEIPAMQSATHEQLEALARVNGHRDAARKLITLHLQALDPLDYEVDSIDVARVGGHFIVEASPSKDTDTEILNIAASMGHVLGFSTSYGSFLVPNTVTLTNPIKAREEAEYVVDELRNSLIPANTLILGPPPKKQH